MKSIKEIIGESKDFNDEIKILVFKEGNTFYYVNENDNITEFTNNPSNFNPREFGNKDFEGYNFQKGLKISVLNELPDKIKKIKYKIIDYTSSLNAIKQNYF